MPLRPPIHALALASALVVLLVAPAARPSEIVLSPRHAPGDRYVLELETVTTTEAAASRGGVEPFRERAELAYRAEVEVLEVDSRGRPVRERHARVRVTGANAERAGSLLPDGTSFEVEHAGEGRVRLRGGPPVGPAIEGIVAPLLEGRLEHSPGAELFAPRREVGLGETWTLSKSRARRMLDGLGLRAVRFDGEPTATLRAHDSDPSLVSLHYAIPVSRVALHDVPESMRTSSSSARVEGRIDLAADLAGPVAHVATLELKARGTVATGGAARPSGWSLSRSERSVERRRALESAAPPADFIDP